MNVQDLISHYGVPNKAQLSKKIEIGKATLTDWEMNGIPPQTQATFELQSNGVLKADRAALNLRFKSFRSANNGAQALSA